MNLFWKLCKFFYRILAINLKFQVAPYKLFLVVTKKCHSRCKNCYIWKSESKIELEISEYELMAKSLNSNLFWLNISGGEPTNHSDLQAVIETFLAHCPNLTFINFTSNALNHEELKRIINFLDNQKQFIVAINISLDGPENVHDQLRGIKGNYQLAIKAIQYLNQTKNILWKASMTIFEENQNLIEQTYDSLKKIIPSFKYKNFHLNYSFTSAHYYKNLNSNLGIKNNAFIVPDYFFKWHFSPSEFIESLYLKKMNKYLREKKTPITCSSLKHNIHIDEKGNLYPCTIWDKNLGNIKDYQYDIMQLLKSNAVKETLVEINLKKCPNCWSPCEAYPSIINHLSEAIWSK